MQQRGPNFGSGDIDAALDHASSFRLDDPGRCAAWQTVENLLLDNYFYLPILPTSPHTYAVRPWVLGWQETFERFMATLPTMKVGLRDMSLYE